MFRGGENASKSKSVLVGKLAVFRGVANASKLESVPVGDWRDKSVVERDSEFEAELRRSRILWLRSSLLVETGRLRIAYDVRRV